MNTPPVAPGLGLLVLPKFDNTLGALLIGGLFGTALWGIACVQTYIYFMDSTNNDRRWLKIMITLIWLIDTLDSALIIHILYFYMVSSFGNPIALMKPVWSVMLSVGVTAVSNFMVRGMFLVRVYKLSRKNLWLTGGIGLLSIADLVTTLAIATKAFQISSFMELHTISGLIYSSFTTGDSCDFCLALSLLYFLYRSRTEFKQTNSLIQVLMMYTVNTGLIVAIDAVLAVITYAAMPDNFIFLSFYLLLSKIYVNAYLATLNARTRLRNEHDDIRSFHLTSITNTTSTVPNSSFTTSVSRKMSTSAQAQKSTPSDGSNGFKTAVEVTTVVVKDHEYSDRKVWDGGYAV